MTTTTTTAKAIAFAVRTRAAAIKVAVIEACGPLSHSTLLDQLVQAGLLAQPLDPDECWQALKAQGRKCAPQEGWQAATPQEHPEAHGLVDYAIRTGLARYAPRPLARASEAGPSDGVQVAQDAEGRTWVAILRGRAYAASVHSPYREVIGWY